MKSVAVDSMHQKVSRNEKVGPVERTKGEFTILTLAAADCGISQPGLLADCQLRK
jgi:hypothetical protein